MKVFEMKWDPKRRAWVRGLSRFTVMMIALVCRDGRPRRDDSVRSDYRGEGHPAERQWRHEFRVLRSDRTDRGRTFTFPTPTGR
jgi:hypothetical protein